MEREGPFHIFKSPRIRNQTREAYIQYYAIKSSKELILKIY
jgi:hypothetical protein